MFYTGTEFLKEITDLKKINRTTYGLYSILGAACGLLYGTMRGNLALSLCFGFAIGLIIDSAVYANRCKK